MPTAIRFDLVRSDTGDGGWSLHAPDSPPDDPPLISGVAEWYGDIEAWSRPDRLDYADALAEFERRLKGDAAKP